MQLNFVIYPLAVFKGKGDSNGYIKGITDLNFRWFDLNSYKRRKWAKKRQKRKEKKITDNASCNRGKTLLYKSTPFWPKWTKCKCWFRVFHLKNQFAFPQARAAIEPRHYVTVYCFHCLWFPSNTESKHNINNSGLQCLRSKVAPGFESLHWHSNLTGSKHLCCSSWLLWRDCFNYGNSGHNSKTSNHDNHAPSPWCTVNGSFF